MLCLCSKPNFKFSHWIKCMCYWVVVVLLWLFSTVCGLQSITTHLFPQGMPGLFAGQMPMRMVLVFKTLTRGQIKATAAFIHPGGQEISPRPMTIYKYIARSLQLFLPSSQYNNCHTFYHPFFINVHFKLTVYTFLVKYYYRQCIQVTVFVLYKRLY